MGGKYFLMKSFLVILLFSLPVFAQDQATAARMAAGCGPNEIQFDVKTDKHQHPTSKPEPGKALVYVFADTVWDNATLRVGGLTTRVGLDGAWVGANNFKSYFFFAADPGDHRLCTSQQSKIESRTKTSAAVSLTTEAGKIYYFRTRTPEHPVQHETVELVSVDPAQAQLLIAASSFSTFHQKK
jgi:Protein of unknown function (DUF2846)